MQDSWKQAAVQGPAASCAACCAAARLTSRLTLITRCFDQLAASQTTPWWQWCRGFNVLFVELLRAAVRCAAELPGFKTGS